MAERRSPLDARSRSRARFAVLVFAIALLAAACGGGVEPSSAPAGGQAAGDAQPTGEPAVFDEPFWFSVAAFVPDARIVGR